MSYPGFSGHRVLHRDYVHRKAAGERSYGVPVSRAERTDFANVHDAWMRFGFASDVERGEWPISRLGLEVIDFPFWRVNHYGDMVQVRCEDCVVSDESMWLHLDKAGLPRFVTLDEHGKPFSEFSTDG